MKNKKNKTDKQGYILVLTLMMLSILVVIVTSMFFSETGHTALSKTMIEREKAKLLALAGVQLALNKLTIPKPKQEKENVQKQDKEKKQGPKKEITLLKKILPNLNRWQTFRLTDDLDGINGQIKISISCENGKINLNELYNFATHKFIGEGDIKFDSRKFIQELCTRISQFTGSKDIFKGLVEFLNKRKFPLNETTELLNIPEFLYFQKSVFYEPLKVNQPKGSIYLTDIFTIWTDSSKLQPWMLSDSISAILGLKRAEAEDVNNRQKMIEQLLQNFKVNSDWKVDWNKLLKPLYNKEFETLIKGIENLFNNQFEPNVFSVLSYGTVGEVTQRIYAIIEIESDNAKLKKLYWI